MKAIKRLLSAVLALTLIGTSLVSGLALPVSAVTYEEDFTLVLGADKTESLAVGDVINVTITPDDIKTEAGICSYEATAITFDPAVLSFDAKSVTCASQDFDASASEVESGLIKLMVTDKTIMGSTLHDGEGYVTLSFTVIGKAEETVISIAGGDIIGTDALTLDGLKGAPSEDLTLYFEEEPVEPDVPDVPAEPDVLDEPDTPAEPDIPAESDTPAESDVPDAPAEPEITEPVDGDFTLVLGADKTEGIAVGEVINVTITPDAIKPEGGICSYDATSITFDPAILRFDVKSVTCASQDFDASASEVESGLIKLMVTDKTIMGSTLHDGEGYVTLSFIVIGKAEETVISMADSMVSGTDAVTLGGLKGVPSADLVLSINAHEHVYSEAVTEPTCTEQGYTTYTCECGESYVDDYTDATGHIYGEWYVAVAPTCTEAGTEQRDCENCDVFETRDADATGHSIVKGICENCDYIDDDTFIFVKEDKTATEAKAGLTAGECALEIKDKDGNVLYGDALVGTGCTVTIKDTTYVVVIMGDVSGDGQINSTDFMQIRRHFLGIFAIGDKYLPAADVATDEQINSTDFMKIRRHFLGTFNLYN